MVEITSEEKNKVKKKKKEWKELRIVSETSGTISNAPTLNYRGPRWRREKERVWENFWRYYSWKCPQHGKVNSQSSPGGTKSLVEDKPKEKHAKTLINPTNKG